MNLGALVVRLLLERAQFRTELAQTVQETNAAASRVQGHAATITGAVTDAVNGQTTAVQTATRALSVLGPVAATATAAALAVGAAFHQAQQETLAYEKAIILSGNAAGVTSGQLADMARRIDGVAGTQANAAAALASMTAGGKVAQENLEKVALAAIEMERATGQAIGETEKIFTSLGKDPVKASLRLNESMNHLTASTYAQIKAADNLGETERAVSIAQNAAADVLRDRAAQVEKNLGTMERAWRGVRDLAKEAWDAMLNIGRPDSSADQLSKAGERVAYLEKQVDGRRSRGLATGDLDGQLAAAKALHDTLRETAKLDERAAGIKSDLAAKDKARLELALALEQSASKQEKMAIAIAQANALADRSGASAAERAQLVNAAREKYAEKESRAAKAALSDYDKLMQRLGTDVPKAAAEAEAAQHGYNKAQGEFLVLAGSPAWAKFTNEQRASAAAQFEKKIASEQAAEAIKAEEKATVEATKAREKSLATAEKELEKLRASVVAQEEQNARLGLSKEAIAELDAAKLEMLATDVEMQAANALFLNQNGELFLVLQKQAKAYRDLAQAKRDGAAKQVDVDREKQIEDVAGKAAKEGEKAAERIEQSLTDSLMRGFEAGKDMARNLRDTVVNMFKTMVLRPMVSAIVSPVAGAITGAMGLASAGQSVGGSAGGASNLLSAASLAGNSSFMMGLSGAWGAGGGMMSTLNAGASMLGQASSFMSGMGTIAGALGPIAIGIALLSSLIKKSTPHMGGGSSYSAADGLVTGKDQYTTANYGFADTRTYDDAAGKLTGDLSRTIVTMLDTTATAFGKEAGYRVATAVADDKSKDGAWGSLLIEQMGNKLADWRDTQTSTWAPKVFADGEQGSQEYLAAIAVTARDALKTAIGDVGWASDMLDALGDAPALDGLAATVDAIVAASKAVEQMRAGVVGFSALSDAALSALVRASGGMDGLIASTSAYYDHFYTDAEKAANAGRAVTAALQDMGGAAPATEREYRALVEAQLALGEAGAPTAAALLANAGNFAMLQDALESLAASVGINAGQLRDTIRDGLLGRISGEEMGASIGTMITSGIHNAIAGGFADQISQIFMQGIVQPVIQAAMTGSSISAAVSQASIDAMVAQATAAAGAIGAIMTDPGFQAAMAQISAAIGSLTSASSAGYKAPIVLGGGGGGSGFDSGSAGGSVEPVEEAWRSLLDSIVESTLAAQTELSRLGMTSYERALAEIDDKANNLLKQIADDRGFSGMRTELAGAEQRQSSFSALAESIRATIAQSGDYLINGGTKWLSDAGAEYQREADAAAEAIARLRAELTDMPEEVRKLIEAERALLEARNALRAMEITGDLRTDIERLGMTDMERTLAGIGDRARDYIKSLEDIGQATEENVAVVDEWEKAMRLDAIKKSWKGVSDAMLDEIDRIRGVLRGSGATGFAELQAKFAIATAAARAGDQEAAKSLPELSRLMLEMGAGNVSSSAELRYLQARTAASLEETRAAIALLTAGGQPTISGVDPIIWDNAELAQTDLAPMPTHQWRGDFEAPDNREDVAEMAGSLRELVRLVGQQRDELVEMKKHARRQDQQLAEWARLGVPVVTKLGTKLITEATA